MADVLNSMPETNNPEPELRPSWVKIGVLGLGVLVLLALFYVSPLRRQLGQLQEVSQQIRNFGIWAPLVFTLGVAVLVGIGVPRLLFCVIAGMALGFWWGLFWAQLGTFIGNYVVFVVARTVGHDLAQRYLTRRVGLGHLVRQRGMLGVILARQLPLPGLVINFACALLPIGHMDFILGTLIGQLPQAIPFTLVGAGVLQPSFKKSAWIIGLAVIASIVVWLGIVRLTRRSPP